MWMGGEEVAVTMGVLFVCGGGGGRGLGGLEWLGSWMLAEDAELDRTEPL